MGSGNLRPDQVFASCAVNPALSMIRRENQRALRQTRNEFEAALREREEKARAEREKERQRHDQLLREQEMEREQVFRFYREKGEQRTKEMRALEEAMRQARIREVEELEMQRKAAQKRLDTERFKVDYVALCRAAASGCINIPVRNCLKICAHCHRVLENESFAGRSHLNPVSLWWQLTVSCRVQQGGVRSYRSEISTLSGVQLD
ncbi:hypothetical protein DL769_011208 [Monosporascus sp. CRB-8-3]|nr:hypothetical protein DL769_011208 [Monosporascus sp. CRB-8-3]